ncbi:MAG: hypothetical protein J6Y37_04620 [Paludibacteraceae bacterium]|nr:hypothetical protein [Paludibacteraceae bacterium]
MNVEFLYVIGDYFSTLEKKCFVTEWVLPIMLGIGCLMLSLCGIDTQYDVIEKSFGFVGTLFCFTLASLNMLLGRDKMKEADNYQTNIKYRNRQATLYELVVISYTYLILVEGFLCIGYIIAHMFNFVYIKFIATTLNTLYVILLFNILATTIRTISATYFILMKR